MALGTAGFTAALAIHRMEHNGQRPANGPIVVTGATGGVGSLAIDMLARRGYEVVAVSGKPEADEYLRALGAPAGPAAPGRSTSVPGRWRPARWAGAIDNVGGELLDLAHADRGFLGQHREHRAGGRSPSSRPP